MGTRRPVAFPIRAPAAGAPPPHGWTGSLDLQSAAPARPAKESSRAAPN
jgi:hypothetical protein